MTNKSDGCSEKINAYANSENFFAALIRCKTCNGIIHLSRKRRRHYGCANALKNFCDNTLLIPRKQITYLIINDLKNKFLTSENLKYLYKKFYLGLDEKFCTQMLTLLLNMETAQEISNECAKNDYGLESYSYYVVHTSIQTLALLDEAL